MKTRAKTYRPYLTEQEIVTLLSLVPSGTELGNKLAKLAWGIKNNSISPASTRKQDMLGLSGAEETPEQALYRELEFRLCLEGPDSFTDDEWIRAAALEAEISGTNVFFVPEISATI